MDTHERVKELEEALENIRRGTTEGITKLRRDEALDLITWVRERAENVLNSEIKTYKITFLDVIEAHSEQEAWDVWLGYMADCVQSGDVTVFDFEEVKKV